MSWLRASPGRSVRSWPRGGRDACWKRWVGAPGKKPAEGQEGSPGSQDLPSGLRSLLAGGPMSRSRLGFPPKADRLPDTCSSLSPLNPELPTPGTVNSEHRPGRSPGECPGRQVGKPRAEVHPLALDAGAGARRRPRTTCSSNVC